MASILKFDGDLSGKFRRRLGTETTRLDLERLSRLNGGNSQVYSCWTVTRNNHSLIKPATSVGCAVIHYTIQNGGGVIIKHGYVTVIHHTIYTIASSSSSGSSSSMAIVVVVVVVVKAAALVHHIS